MSIRINTDQLYEEFKDHFELEDNKRILFSSPFGTGKTTFLTEYFEKYQNYNVFKIYPVVYSVSNNEDVFELIKYDLLFQLFERSESGEVDLIDNDFSMFLAFQVKFLKQVEWSPILFKIIELADKTGKFSVVEKLVENVKSQYNHYKEKQLDEKENIYEYLFQQYTKLGSPRERDLNSQLISDLLVRLKTNSEQLDNDTDENPNQKENILIIDDLDRLDPEHIFRLFNVFSVNFGKDQVENKFGFDKIIIVCDLNNIRQIYAHRYGSKVDFEGYIDKFYSKYPYKFSTNKLLSGYLKEFTKHFNLSEEFIDFSDLRNLDYNQNYLVLKGLLNSFILTNKINLRSLLSSNNISVDDAVISFNKRTTTHASQFPLITIFKIFEIIFDSKEILLDILLDLSNTYHQNTFRDHRQKGYFNDNDGAINSLMELAIPFLVNYNDLQKLFNEAKSSDVNNVSLLAEEMDLSVVFNIQRNFGRSNDYSTIFRGLKYSDDREELGEEISINPYKVLFISLKKCISLEML